MLEAMHHSGRSRKSNKDFQLWQHNYNPIQWNSNHLIEYIHMSPVKAGFVSNPKDFLFRSERNYAGLEAVMEIDGWTGSGISMSGFWLES